MLALVDCNNFYASCERVFNPTIVRRPVIVLSGNDGCIISRSNEAKALGFRMTDPFFKVRHLARKHDVAVFSSNYTLYGDMSRRVMQTLEQLAPEVEVYSIDEAFLKLAGFAADRLGPMAVHIRDTVRRWTGIPVSIGIGPTKTLAKAANRVAKKSPGSGGIWSIANDDIRVATLGRLRTGEVWGIGQQRAKQLERYGIADALTLSRQPDVWVRTHLGLGGLRTVMELRGEACESSNHGPRPRKSVVVSRTFSERLTQFEPIKQALVTYVSRAGEKLRRDNRLARHMLVYLNNSRFTTTEEHYSKAANLALPRATSDTGELIHHACAGLRQIFREGFHYSKCGVVLTGLGPDWARQGELFEAPDSGRRRQLTDALDEINRHMGRNTVFYAASGHKREGVTVANMRTQAYTTDWQQLLRVRV